MRVWVVVLIAIASCTANRIELHEPKTNAAVPLLEPLDVKESDPVHRLVADHSLYFWENHSTGAQFTELRANGTYRSIAREHMGVGEDDAGRWRQAENGELHLCSAYQFHYLQAGPLWIVVVGKAFHDQLPTLRDALRGILSTHTEDTFEAKEIEWPFSNGEPDYHRPSVNSDKLGRAITRVEVEALTRAIDGYMTSGNENLFRTMPRIYRDRVYLDGSWQVPGRAHDADDLAALHRHIEANDSLGALLAIDAPTFETSIHMTQRFVFHPEMNDCVARTVADVPDNKGARVEPHCRSF